MPLPDLLCLLAAFHPVVLRDGWDLRAAARSDHKEPGFDESLSTALEVADALPRRLVGIDRRRELVRAPQEPSQVIADRRQADEQIAHVGSKAPCRRRSVELWPDNARPGRGGWWRHAVTRRIGQ